MDRDDVCRAIGTRFTQTGAPLEEIMAVAKYLDSLNEVHQRVVRSAAIRDLEARTLRDKLLAAIQPLDKDGDEHGVAAAIRALLGGAAWRP